MFCLSTLANEDISGLDILDFDFVRILEEILGDFFIREHIFLIVVNFWKGPMGAKFTICCCQYYLKHNSEEKNAILRMRTTTASRQPVVSSESSDSDTEEESLFGPRPSRKRTEEPWADTRAACVSPDRRGSDRELQAFISMRDQADKATEEWEKLNYDIHSLRYSRREVRSRWKKILLQLGYQCEVDALLCVNKRSRFSRDQDQLNKATELLKQLLDRTSLFPPETEHQSKYLCVMDRLVSLDSAEDFVKLAKEKYPKQSSLRDSERKKEDVKAGRKGKEKCKNVEILYK